MFNLFKKDPREKIIRFIKKNFSKEVSEILTSNLKTCFVLDNITNRKLEIGTSKQSGYPDVPVNFRWPENNGRTLDFILQINLQEFESTKIGLPEKGMLYFFLDLKEEEFPSKKNQYKVFYWPENKDLKRRKYEKKNQVEEKPLKINESLTFPESQSYLLMDVELTDQEFDELINLDYPIISELFGGGIYDVGKLAESSIINEWVEIYNRENNKELNPAKSTDKFIGLLSFMLDEWEYVDSWVHFGIEKEELRKKQFDRVKISFTST